MAKQPCGDSPHIIRGIVAKAFKMVVSRGAGGKRAGQNPPRPGKGR